MKNFHTIVYLVLIFLFSYTAISKTLSFDFFASQLSLYPFLRNYPRLISALVPAAETIAVVLLFIPALRLWGLYFSLLLLLLFTGYLIIMLATQTGLPCTCGGVISKMTWKQHVWFNCFFILITFVAIYTARKKTKTNNNYNSNSLLQ